MLCFSDAGDVDDDAAAAAVLLMMMMRVCVWMVIDGADDA